MSARRIVGSAAALGLFVGVGSWAVVAALPLQAGITDLAPADPGPVEQRAALVANPASLPVRSFSEAPAYPVDAQASGDEATVTLRTSVDEAGNVAELRLAGIRFRIGGVSGALEDAPSMAKLDEFLAGASVRESSSSPATAERVRPTLDAFVEAAAFAVRRTRYEPPPAGRAVVFNTVVEFSRNAPPSSRDVPVVGRGPSVRDDGAIRVGGNIRTPIKIKDAKPVYPPEARQARVQGVVIIEVRVEPDGRVGDARILRSIPLLDQAALDAVRQWTFQPTLLNGAPVPVIMTVTVQFALP